ncbi:MAG: DUF4169 family protein [Pseudomonadota bacterium]
MSGKPVNLNAARKARDRMKKRGQANENAVKFGRKKSEKSRDRETIASFKSRIDAHKREP